jgi:hypothetical protein
MELCGEKLYLLKLDQLFNQLASSGGANIHAHLVSLQNYDHVIDSHRVTRV